SFGGFEVPVLLAQQNPGKRYNRVRVYATRIGDKDSKVLRHFGSGQRRTTTLDRWFYKLVLFVFESGGIQSYFPGKLVSDVSKRPLRLSDQTSDSLLTPRSHRAAMPIDYCPQTEHASPHFSYCLYF